MNKYLIMQMIKAVKIPAIIGVVSFLVGLILTIIGVTTLVSDLCWPGVILMIVGGICIAAAVISAKQVKNAICPSCYKYMGESEDEVDYEISLAQADRCFDQSGKPNGYFMFSYNYSITCPHCGNTVMKTDKIRSKNEAEANVAMDKRVKAILGEHHKG